jgi:predicted DNA-binding protein
MSDVPVAPALRQSCVSSISLPRELSEWVDSQAKTQGVAKSKLVQQALAHYRATVIAPVLVP